MKKVRGAKANRKREPVKLDPITFEIIKNKMLAAINEAGAVLVRTSGSEVVVTVREYTQSYYTADGHLILTGGGILLHVKSIAEIVKYLIQNYEHTIGIHEGDMFIFSDPYLGGMHPPDQTLVAPIFWKGKRVGFCASLTHIPDTGAIDAGGFCPRATDTFQEGLRLRGLRVMRGGERCEDVFNTIKGMVRLPDTVELDILSKVASNNVLIKRAQELIEKYGLETYERLSQELIRYSERLAREKLRKIADGEWRSVTYLEHDGIQPNLFRIQLTAKKTGDRLTLDYTGSSPQASTSVNATYHAAMGCAFAILAGRLFYDIPWNEGILKPLELKLPENCIINAKFPAAVSQGMPAGGGIVVFAVQDVLSKMLLASGEELRREASSVFGWSVHFALPVGIDQYGKFFVWPIMDECAGGMGARTYKDGVGTAGTIQTPKVRIGNIEEYEQRYPLLFFFRREEKNSAGAGKFRGGAGGELCFSLHKSPTKYVDVALSGAGIEPAIALGMAGGLPARQGRFIKIRKSNAGSLLQEGKIPQNLEEIQGEKEFLPPKGYTRIDEGDCFYLAWLGGGGFGDPIERDPELVRQDILDEIVSPEFAERIYGVVRRDGSKIDQPATAKRREEIRRERLTPAA
ncbi:MAG: hydantoinase B/oxoprolinase family protein [Deltaproteobacteria bacterium]|nr:hydantoinase B/oxoprolinase family protein [Deltaproteobacteria bacterium]